MEIEFLKRIVKEAEKIAEKTFEVKQKDDQGDLVTNLDLEIEKYLISEIKQNYPDFDIVSEEFNTNNKVSENCFIIDPIDGTINFANGLPLWGTQIACVKNGETVASVINLPKLGELYWADKSGAYLNGEKISVKEVPIKNAIFSIMGNKPVPFVEKVYNNYSRNYRNFGAACAAFAFMASGRIHGVNFRPENTWDFWPGIFLCKMAGAKIKDEPGFHAAAMNQEFLEILERETGLNQ